jgi:REP element-mobilizing transposase RayT
VHLLVSYPPKVSVSALVNSLKGTPARRLRPQYTGKASTPGSRSAWPDGQAGAYPALKDGACAPNLVT